MTGTASTSQARSGRWLRWALRLVAAVAAVAAIVLAAAATFLGHLDEPWAKRRIQALARSIAGGEIDYESARVRPFSGLRVENLVLLSPPEFRGTAPHLLRVGRLEMTWSLSSLLGDGAMIQRIGVDEVSVTIVEDERGRTSLEGLSPKAERPRAEPTRAPRPSTVLPRTAPPVGRLDLSRVELTWVRTGGGQLPQGHPQFLFDRTPVVGVHPVLQALKLTL